MKIKTSASGEMGVSRISNLTEAWGKFGRSSSYKSSEWKNKPFLSSDICLFTDNDEAFTMMGHIVEGYCNDQR